MEEAEELLAPLKLVIRIVRRPRTQSASVKSPESVSILRKFLGWDGFSFVFFTGLAFAFLQLPLQYEKARWCFIAAAIVLVIKVAHSVNVEVYPKMLVAILGAILAGLGVNRINEWVSQLEVEAIARDVPQIRIIMAKSVTAPAVPPRSDVVLDGLPYFLEQKDERGQLLADQNLLIGQPLAFNYRFKQVGPNPVELAEDARSLYIESDYEPSTQRRLIAKFKREMQIYREPDDGIKETNTFTQGRSAFDTAFAVTPDRHERIVTQDDLNALHAGTEIAFLIAQLTYVDNRKMHHARLCAWLQPPAHFPGVWHNCIGFNHSD